MPPEQASEEWEGSDDVIADKGAANARNGYEYLGERCRHAEDGTVWARNAPHLLDKLRTAYARFEGGGGTTRRQLAALFGLAHFLVGTLDVSPAGTPELLRAHSAISAQASCEGSWDAPAWLSAQPAEELRRLVTFLVSDPEVRVEPLTPPSTRAADYDVVAWVDACATGWAAFVRRGDRVWKIEQGWTAALRFSAHAEPRAAEACLRWIDDNLQPASVALVVDHQPLASAQRCWWSGLGGWSSAWPLNSFFVALYGVCAALGGRGARTGAREVFFVPGVKNIADGPSRSVPLGAALSVTEVECVLPGLEGLWHPHFDHREIPYWHV